MRHMMTMWCVMALMAFALSVESYVGHDHEHLSYGRKLKIYLNKNADKLLFSSEKNLDGMKLYWTKGQFRVAKGRVTGTGIDKHWYIDKVTFEDQGTYIQKDSWNREISVITVNVTSKMYFVKRVAGETLRISLEGIRLDDATLKFYGDFSNETLVAQGAPVSQNNPYYYDRVMTYSTHIDIKNVNYTDVGHYILHHKRWRVSVTKMDLTDHHESTGGNPLLALLLLLGIPAGICCCCRKKIFKEKATPAAALQTTTEIIHQPPSGPVGPSPPYSPPGQPGVMYYNNQPDPSTGPTVHPPPNAGPGQWNGQPPYIGFNPAYPPQNPAYNPAAPATFPPGQPPQWNGPQPGLYPMGPGAPMGYAPAPVMYSAAPPTASEPVKQENKIENMASSPTTPLMSTTPQPEVASPPAAPVPPSSNDALNSSGDAYQFQIDGKNNPSNFL